MTYPIAASVLHIHKPETRSASVRFIDDYKVEIKRAGRETRTYHLLDMSEASEKRLRLLVENASFETHEYTEWVQSRYTLNSYEVPAIEHCYRCQPDIEVDHAPRPSYVSWMDNPVYYRCAGSY